MSGTEAFLKGCFKGKKNPIKQTNICLKCGQEQVPGYKYPSIKTLLLALCSVAAYHCHYQQMKVPIRILIFNSKAFSGKKMHKDENSEDIIFNFPVK